MLNAKEAVSGRVLIFVQSLYYFPLILNTKAFLRDPVLWSSEIAFRDRRFYEAEKYTWHSGC